MSDCKAYCCGGCVHDVPNINPEEHQLICWLNKKQFEAIPYVRRDGTTK